MELASRGVILVKKEATYGTDPAPTEVNAVVATGISWKAQGEKVARNAAGPSMSPWAHRIGVRSAEISFDVDLRGFGSAYSAVNLPETDALLRACGLAPTVVTTPGAEKVTYNPASTAHESCAIWFYDGGVLYKLAGCRGDVEFGLEVGKAGSAKFSMSALFAKPATAVLVTPTWLNPTVQPPVFLSGAFTLGAYAAVVSKLGLKMGNTIGKRMSANEATGVKEILITGRAPSGSVDPEMELIAAKDFFTEWLAGTPQAVLATLGDTQYNRVKFSAPKAQYDSVALADRDGVRTLDLPFECKRTSGDDEIQITFD
jgi:hypothetical protein